MNKSLRIRTRVSIAALSTVAVVSVAACGNRVDHAAIEAVGNGYGPVAASEANGATTGATTVVPGTATDPSVVAPVVPGTQGNAVTVPNPGTGTAAGAATPQAGGNKPGGGGGQAPGSGTAAPARCSSALAPIRLGQTLATSGLVGASINGLRTGLAVWAKEVNARGGVQCHPVELTQLDDGADASRVSANWNTLVRERGAVALLAAGTPVASAALRSAAERDKVPVIGADLNSEDYFSSPYLFPQGGLPLTAYDGSYYLATKAAGANGTAGLIYCVEISICTGVKNNHEKAAKRAGLKLGAVQAASLTQPDYAAECQAMKASGVTVLFLALDGSGSVRAARSCTSIGYKPAIASSAIAISAQAGADQTLRSLGVYLGTNNVPFMSNSPAAALFRDAMKRFAPTAPLEEQALFGYASGKLFEAALAKVADKARAGNVTSEMVLQGLWQLKNEKMGGLGPGVTFTQGKPATAPDCFYGIKIGTDGLTAPIGAAPVCYDKNGKPNQSANALAAAQPAAAHPGADPSASASDSSLALQPVSSSRQRHTRRRPPGSGGTRA